MSIKVEDGVSKQIIQEAGAGAAQLKIGQTITVHCTGSLAGADGAGDKKFWSTKDPGQKAFTFEVGIGKVIRGWDVGCLTMKVGEKAVLTVRGDKGYGKSGFPAWGITPNATLKFEIEVLSAE
ncbi:uncharacterized protein LOC135502797 [Lineus longissimus]|uniref:uncharacterized protein LOC135502797 n=1 Tax=Lineus longissimus TaxID=88925 RepID=UPI002B4F5AD9